MRALASRESKRLGGSLFGSLRGALLVLVMLALAIGGSSAVLAGGGPPDPPPAPPSPMDGSSPEEPGPPAAAAPEKGGVVAPPTPMSLTDEQLNELVLRNPVAFGSLILFKFVTAALGLGVLILLLVRRSDERKGLVAPRSAGPPAVAPFALGGAFALVVLWFVAPQVVSLVVAHLAEEPDGKPSILTSLASMCVTSLPIALVIVWVARRRRAQEDLPAVSAGESLRIAGRVFLISAFVVLVLQIVSAMFIKHVLGIPPEMQHLVTRVIYPSSPIEPWLIAFLGVFVAPFAEEAVFRGTLYPALRRHIGVRKAAWAVSLFFGVIHMNALAFLPLVGLALLLTWCYERTGSIYAGVVVHALSNAASLVPLLLIS